MTAGQCAIFSPFQNALFQLKVRRTWATKQQLLYLCVFVLHVDAVIICKLHVLLYIISPIHMDFMWCYTFS
jgi:hypothetical protein